ncbi:hypothetical protein SPRG_16827 [Saprolegnia parasitica CBS 223.65]|uniref:Apple domain-containing protein n=1 Tax=Saprolegnia parasitica (strain CBS 223.65) TaxID=695850 RepID=A0A067BU12_SAPPC|nr:hypothetical protein SPRG_16827 [Saprolegnia parasitica CBS 223.65]KDO17766.1 hypothetical protein SPRG_16827 [Saprolegnia parasitica CBS 223.65]|eukprot:XP_012211525.1 hypothetical protein SPRG_16827 [Saprolegnia parasitica CBS 223.65]
MKLLSSYVALAAAGLSAADAAEFVFNNKCSYTINLYAAHGKHLCDIAPGQTRDKSCGVTISHEKPGIFRHTASDQVNLIEYVLNGRLWYDFSNIPPMPGNCNSFQDCKEKTKAVGFNVPMSLTPTRHKGKANCKALLDDKPDAPDAYLFPADTKTHDCPADEVFDIVFCPGGSAPAPASGPSNAAPTANTCSTQMDVDYPGNDIGSIPVTGDRNTQVGQCCAKCSGTTNCAAFTVGYNTCYMKSSKGNPRPSSGLVSGVPASSSSSSSSGTCTAQMGVDFTNGGTNNDIGNGPVSGSTTEQLAQCCAMCHKNDKCVAYSVGYGSCYMKSSVGVPRANAHVSSGIKGAGPSIQWKQDYWGNDIRGIDVPGSAVDQATMCHSLCKTTSNCAGFTMNGGRCYLKSQLANGYKSDTAYSGTKN